MECWFYRIRLQLWRRCLFAQALRFSRPLGSNWTRFPTWPGPSRDSFIWYDLFFIIDYDHVSSGWPAVDSGEIAEDFCHFCPFISFCAFIWASLPGSCVAPVSNVVILLAVFLASRASLFFVPVDSKKAHLSYGQNLGRFLHRCGQFLS